MEQTSSPGPRPGITEAVVELSAALEARLAELARTEPMAALTAATGLERLARAAAEQAAARAAGRGMSWAAIGAACGVSKQAAHQRFARHVRRLSRPGP